LFVVAQLSPQRLVGLVQRAAQFFLHPRQRAQVTGQRVVAV
jgi:hypothetical protein